MKNNVDYQVSTHISETCYPQSLMIAPWLSSSSRRERRFSCCVFVFFVIYSSFNHFPILLSYYWWTKRDSSLLHLRLWRYLPIFPINVRHRSLPDQINCNWDHIQKHISFLSKEKHILDSSSFYLTIFPINVRRRSLPD